MTTEFWGAVPVAGRGSLPFALVHGEALVSAATLALQGAGVDMCDASIEWTQIQTSGRGVVLHDPLCPLTPPDFIRDTVAQAGASAAVTVGVRPVTDTVKRTDGSALGDTVDRESLRQVCSPIVLPASVVQALPDWPRGAFEEVVAQLRRRWPVTYVDAPALARRVDSEESVQVLEALSLSRADAARGDAGPG